ncbi:MAG TPA: LysR family transcriptional regulator [Stellaceae bacterium]|jgi:DNA-binding transcriptional LysR family regulator|nr:LysR family transcriptional regulator [Stellaceae bacterium]
MDFVQKLKAFVATVERGTFSGAARALGSSASVILKRVDELEFELKSTLFVRTTRHIALTEIGELYLPHIRKMLRDHELLTSGQLRAPGNLEGIIKIKAMTIPTLAQFGQVLSDFWAAHPGLVIEFTASDTAGNPIDHGVDIAIGIDNVSYENVQEEVLCPYPRVICGAPDYLARRGKPLHPNDLYEHRCLAFGPVGAVWPFKLPNGRLNIDVRPALVSNSPQQLQMVALSGGGIAQLSLLAAAPDLAAGRLVQVLEDFPLDERWLKMFVPESRANVTRVKALTAAIRDYYRSQPAPNLKAPEFRPGGR